MRDVWLYISAPVLFFVMLTIVLQLQQPLSTIITVALVVIEGLIYLRWLSAKNIFRIDVEQEKPSVNHFIKHSIMKGPHDIIQLYHGDLSPIFFLNKDVLRSFRQAGKIQIIFGPKIFLQSLEKIFICVANGKIQLYQRQAPNRFDRNWRRYQTSESRRFNHFIIVDNSSCWLEWIHPPGECYGGRELCGVAAYRIVETCRKKFKSAQSGCKEIDWDLIVDSIGRENIVTGYDKEIDEWIIATDEDLSNFHKRIQTILEEN